MTKNPITGIRTMCSSSHRGDLKQRMDTIAPEMFSANETDLAYLPPDIWMHVGCGDTKNMVSPSR